MLQCSEYLKSCCTFRGVSLGRAGSNPGSLGHCCPRVGRRVGGDRPLQPWLWGSAVTCSLCSPSPSLTPVLEAGGQHRSVSVAALHSLPALCSALPLGSCVISPVPSLPSCLPHWCYFCSTFSLSFVLSCLSFCLGLPSVPLFVLCMSLLHLWHLSFLSSQCVFFCLCSLSFAISFDSLFPLLSPPPFLFCFIPLQLLFCFPPCSCSLSLFCSLCIICESLVCHQLAV